MKNIALIFLCLCLASCETESLVVKNAPKDNLAENPQLTAKLLRVAQYPTAIDNIIDKSSCFALGLPVTVIANGQNVIIVDPAGYQGVRDIFDQSNNDVDTVTLTFPVTVVYPDYTQSVFATQAELNAAIIDCVASTELSCVGFQFPLGIKTYDTKNQYAETFFLGNKEALFNFLSQLTSVATFSYPLNFSVASGAPVTITGNEVLEALIDDNTDECLSGLDPGPVDPDPVLEDVIVQGTWFVSYLFRDNDQTSDYAAFDFRFNSNGSVTITGVPTPGSGTWDRYIASGEEILEFTFTNGALEELEEDWTVTEFTQTTIKMQHESGGASEIRYLTFQKN